MEARQPYAFDPGLRHLAVCDCRVSGRGLQQGVFGRDFDQHYRAVHLLRHSRLSAFRAGKIERGPWHLGGYSKAINVAAVLWVIFLSVILSLADIVNTGASILAVTIALALWYGLRERRRFKGPAWAAAQTSGGASKLTL